MTSKELFTWGCVAMAFGVLGLATCGTDPAASRAPEMSTRTTRQPITQARETSSAPLQVPVQALLGSWHDGHDGCAYLSEGDSDLSIQLQVWTCSLGGQTSADALLTGIGREYRGSGNVVRLVPRQDGSLSILVTSQWVDKEGKPYGPGEFLGRVFKRSKTELGESTAPVDRTQGVILGAIGDVHAVKVSTERWSSMFFVPPGACFRFDAQDRHAHLLTQMQGPGAGVWEDFEGDAKKPVQWIRFKLGRPAYPSVVVVQFKRYGGCK